MLPFNVDWLHFSGCPGIILCGSWWRHDPRYWLLWGVSTGHRCILITKASDADLWIMSSLICAWTNGWANNRDADDLKRHRTHHDVIVMCPPCGMCWSPYFSHGSKMSSKCEKISIIAQDKIAFPRWIKNFRWPQQIGKHIVLKVWGPLIITRHPYT